MESGEENISSIINGCIINDRKAQQQLYKNYYKAMMNICLRYTKNEQDALSVLNGAFYKVFKSIKTYDASKSVIYTWIRSIVINHCIDHVKTSKSKILLTGIDEAEPIHVEPSILEKMKEGELLLFVKSLPPATQAVFNLYIMEGYSHKEIGQILSISEGTSKWHLNDARKKLKLLITNDAIK